MYSVRLDVHNGVVMRCLSHLYMNENNHTMTYVCSMPSGPGSYWYEASASFSAVLLQGLL